jgi:probable HAF family extracellular repeat protein
MKNLFVYLILISTASRLDAATFTSLGDLPDGIFFSAANAISSDGTAAVGYSESDEGPQAFRWSFDEGMVGLGSFLGTFSEASRVSADGSVVVGSSVSPNGQEGFRWTENEGMVGLGVHPDYTGTWSYSPATGLSADGSVISGWASKSSGVYEATRWIAQTGLVGIGSLTGQSSYARDVSADGTVIVGNSFGVQGPEAFRWTESGGMVGLGDFPGGTFSSEAYSISEDGQTIVGRATSATGWEAFRWTATGMIGLGDLHGGNTLSYANDVSANGEVVVDVGFTQRGMEAFRWDEQHGMESIQQILRRDNVLPDGWQLNTASGISADGSTIVGMGRNPSGMTEAWIATGIVPGIPEPSCLTMGFAMLGILLSRSKRLV